METVFDRIKGLMDVQQQIDDIKQKTDANAEAVRDFSDQMKKLEEDLRIIRESQDTQLEGLKRNITTFTNLREDLGKEIYGFKMLKSQLQRKMLDRFEQELTRELSVNTEAIQKDLSDYEDMKESMKALLRKMELSKQELDKWMDISKSVKKEDFELHSFARQLQQADQEKLQLMRKIDNLERLVSKMRRGQPQQVRR